MAPTYSSASFGDYGRKPIQSAQAELINAAELEHDASLFAGRANSFTCPLGDTPGYGYLLMQRKHVLELHQEFIDQGNTALEKDLQIGIDWIFVDALAAVRPKWITLQHLILVNATRVYPGYEEDENSIMLVEVADVRYWLKKSFIDTQYNVRCITETTDDKYWTPSLKVDTENTGEDAAPCQYGCRPWTWREVLQDIWEHFPEEYQDLVPELPVLYDNLWDAIPERLTFNCMSALTAYCETLRLAGGAMLGFDPVQHEFRIVIPGGLNTDTDFATLKTSYRQSLYKKQEVLNNSPAFIPEKIRVVFEAVYDTREVEEFFLRPKYTIEIPFANYLRDAGMSDSTVLRAKEGTVEIINAKKDAFITGIDPADCLCPELPPEPEDPDEPGFLHPQNLDRLPEPDNYTDLEECAKDLAYRFWDYRITDEPTELVYEGCLPFRHGDKVFQVTWRNVDHKGWQTRLEYHRALKEFFDTVTTPFRELRSQAGCGEDTCENVYHPEILSEGFVSRQFFTSTGIPYGADLIAAGPACLEFSLNGVSTDDGISQTSFELWFVDTVETSSGYLDIAPAYMSNQFSCRVNGLWTTCHWEFVSSRRLPGTEGTGSLGSLILVTDDYSNRVVDWDGPPPYSAHYLAHSGVVRVTASASLYYPVNQTISTTTDFVTDTKVRLVNRHALGGVVDVNQGYISLLPLAKFPATICISPKKYPSSVSTTPPLAQVWGGTPPYEINVSMSNRTDTIAIRYAVSGKLDAYVNGVPGNSNYKSRWRFRILPIINNGEVDTSKIAIINSGFTGYFAASEPAGISWRKEIDFSSPLDYTFTDDRGVAYRFYE